MRRGKPASSEDEEVAEMTLEQLNCKIAHMLWGSENGGTSQGRKSFFKRLVWLEAKREELHGIEAKKRRFNSN